MDDRQFDAIASVLGQRPGRRQVLTRATGAALAALTGRVVGDDAAAVERRRVCRPAGTGCVRDSNCCSGRCETDRSLPRTRRNRCSACAEACDAAQVCVAGECRCPDPAQILCGGACVGIGTAEHCASCDPCADGFTCYDRPWTPTTADYVCQRSVCASVQQGCFVTSDGNVVDPGSSIGGEGCTSSFDCTWSCPFGSLCICIASAWDGYGTVDKGFNACIAM
jgi:hypothetical protein